MHTVDLVGFIIFSQKKEDVYIWNWALVLTKEQFVKTEATLYVMVCLENDEAHAEVITFTRLFQS